MSKINVGNYDIPKDVVISHIYLSDGKSTTSDGTTSDGTTNDGTTSDGKSTTSDGTTSDGTTSDGKSTYEALSCTHDSYRHAWRYI